jgi:hypothetical protein
MNLIQSCGINAFLIKCYPGVVQAFYILSLKLTSITYQTEITCT